MLFRRVALVYQSDNVLIAIYSTLKGCKPKTKVQTGVLDKLLYTDDMNKNARSEATMQRSMDQV